MYSIPIRNTRLFVMTLFMILSTLTAIPQAVVGLDNWFNNETNARTNQPFHYLWSDTAFSGYSQWGEIFKDRGASLTTMTRPSPASISKIDIYILVDPDTTSETPYPNYISVSDIKTIKEWVKKGGVLAVLANDAPNCEFTNLNRLMKEFGMTFNHATLHPVPGSDWEKGASVGLPDHPLFKGVSKIYIKEVSDIKLAGTARSILIENGKTLIAENNYGKGYVFAIGDPWIYNEYIDHAILPESFENKEAATNLTDLLISKVKKK